MQWVKDQVLSLQWLRLLLWRGFNPWLWVEPKKKIAWLEFLLLCCCAMGSVASLQHQETGLIPSPALWIKGSSFATAEM